MSHWNPPSSWPPWFFWVDSTGQELHSRNDGFWRTKIPFHQLGDIWYLVSMLVFVSVPGINWNWVSLYLGFGMNHLRIPSCVYLSRTCRVGPNKRSKCVEISRRSWHKTQGLKEPPVLRHRKTKGWHGRLAWQHIKWIYEIKEKTFQMIWVTFFVFGLLWVAQLNKTYSFKTIPSSKHLLLLLESPQNLEMDLDA